MIHRLHVHGTADAVESGSGYAGPFFHSGSDRVEDGLISPIRSPSSAAKNSQSALCPLDQVANIDAGAAAQNLTHGIKDGTSVQVRVRFCEEGPVELTA